MTTKARSLKNKLALNRFYPWHFLFVVGVGMLILSGFMVVYSIHEPTKQAYAEKVITPTSPLPFDLPAQSMLKASSKKVFAHYFSPYPISLDNASSVSDYYQTQYLNPTGENGIHAAYGGLLRERPLNRTVDSSTNWQVNDMKTEVSRATNAGLDGFTYDMLGLSGVHWDRLNYLLQAAPQVDPNFKIILMPDSNSTVVNSPSQLAASIASIAHSSALYKLGDGRLVVSPFYPETKGVSWWANFLSIMKNTYGITVAFVPCFLDYNSNAAAFASISYGFSNWGNRNPAANTNIASLISDAHARGKIWMQPVSLQDNRPNQKVYWEANNTENLRTTWAGAIGGADWVQIPTWNDYSENTQISPSSHIGYSPLDITSYYTTWFKQARAPSIARDVVYVSHRVQPAAATPSGQSQPMILSQYSGPARDTVEVLSFLTATSSITVKVGTNTYTYVAPAGVSAKTYPLTSGSVSASVARGGALVADVSGKFPVTSSRAYQDLQYYFVSSGREGNTYQQDTVATGGSGGPLSSTSSGVPVSSESVVAKSPSPTSSPSPTESPTAAAASDSPVVAVANTVGAAVQTISRSTKPGVIVLGAAGALAAGIALVQLLALGPHGMTYLSLFHKIFRR